MAGLVFNGLRPLERPRGELRIQGPVRRVSPIPFDYRERHPRLFENGFDDDSLQMQKTNPSSRQPEPGVDDDLFYARSRCTGDDDSYYDSQCFTVDGSGDELITPVYKVPPRPTRKPKRPRYRGGVYCDEDDDEDCYDGSGDGAYIRPLIC